MSNRPPPPQAAEAVSFYLDLVSGLPVEKAALRFSGHRDLIEGLRFLHDGSSAVLQWAAVFFGSGDELPPQQPVPGLPGEGDLAGERDGSVTQTEPTSSDQPAPPPKPDNQGGTNDLRLKLDGLKNYRDLRHIAADLADRLAVDAVPRKGSRGNALLWVLHQFRRKQGLSLDDLEYAFKRMGVFTTDDPEARRKVAWELGELGRKGWPIKSDGSLYRLELPGGRS
jgi:hypothetical protein